LTWSSTTTTTRIVPLTLTRGLAHRPGLAAFPSRKMRSGWIRRSRTRGRSRKASLRIFEVLMDEVVGGGTGRCRFGVGVEREAVSWVLMGPAGEGRFGSG